MIYPVYTTIGYSKLDIPLLGKLYIPHDGLEYPLLQLPQQVPLEIPEVSARSLNRNVAQMRVQQAQQATLSRSSSKNG